MPYSPPNLSVARVRECLRYEPSSGRLYWLPHTSLKGRSISHTGVAGTSIGPYVYVSLDGYRLLGHHIAWALSKGHWATEQLDHEDGDGRNNRIGNLREAGQLANCRNMQRTRLNKSGVSGVTRDSTRNKWQVHIRNGGKNTALGRFDSFDEAVATRKVAEQRLGYHPNHGRDPRAQKV